MNAKVYLKLIGFGVGLTLIISVFSAVGVITQAGDDGMLGFQIVAFLLAASGFTLYMKKKDRSLELFGFKKRQVAKEIYFIIGCIVIVQPLVLGIDFSLSLKTIALIIIQMVLVGYTEEVLFRGIYFNALKDKSPKTFIIFSAIVFGVLHIASGLNPDAALSLVILQIINALLLGSIFAVLYYYTKTIYVVIAFHALFNIFASITPENSVEMNVLAVSILSVVYAIVLVFLWLRKERFKA